MSITYSEIKQQYAALQQTFDYMRSKREDILGFFNTLSVTSITFLGCGSGYCLSKSAAFSAQLRAGIPSIALAGGDLMLNAKRYQEMLKNTLLIVPSRSGSTSEIIQAIHAAQTEKHIPVLSISSVANSSLSQIADFALEIPWAFDHSVCQTRNITNLYIANLMLSAFIGNDEQLIADIETAIQQGEEYMLRVENAIRETADFEWSNAVLLADGELQGLASEGAIALTEIAKVQAQSHHLLDVRHGPMVTVGPQTLVIALLTQDGSEYQHKLMHEIKSRGAKIIAFADHVDVVPLDAVDLAVISDSGLDIAAQGIPFMFIPQIVALSYAERNGINPDEPDGLTAWVKL
jgi:glucosamine--fructose-6-phosphate aminotransferase (isomerizing)